MENGNYLSCMALLRIWCRERCPVNIAIFADVHGRILLCFKLCARWEKETGEKIDLILQCGDLGVFPDPSWLDGATKKHALKDPEEMGYYYYFTDPGKEVINASGLARYRREAEAVLGMTSCNLVFVRRTTRITSF